MEFLDHPNRLLINRKSVLSSLMEKKSISSSQRVSSVLMVHKVARRMEVQMKKEFSDHLKWMLSKIKTLLGRIGIELSACGNLTSPDEEAAYA